MTPQKQVWKHLQEYGPKTVRELITELNLKPTQVYNATMRLKNDGFIGKQNDKWAIGCEHVGNINDFKGKLLTLIEQGKYDAQEMAEILGTNANRVASEISRLKNGYGLNIKRVYVVS